MRACAMVWPVRVYPFTRVMDVAMEVLPLLIFISLAVIAMAVWLFFRMSDSGQFDDTEGPARRILMDDDRPAVSTAEIDPSNQKRR